MDKRNPVNVSMMKICDSNVAFLRQSFKASWLTGKETNLTQQSSLGKCHVKYRNICSDLC